ncbi:hypothetical protein [Actinospica robiniae]|uniref:hypothetical protein n=1 Tax=Actinospica robiniae TaxID=304901 RepID=UPI0004074377|nr:hypothetical protein [Actinospica robiniae]
MDFAEIIIDGPIPVDRDDIEDGLNEVFEGVGEIIGAGTGMGISDLALEVEPDRVGRADALNRVFSVLGSFDVGDSVRVRPGDREVWYRLGEWKRGEAS